MRRHAALVLGSLLLTLCIAEVSLRVFDYVRGADSRARATWYWGFRQDRYLGFRPRESVNIRFASGNFFDTNREGFRDTEFDDSVNANVIVALGESSTWGTGSSDKYHTWPQYLARAIKESGDSSWRVMNAGLPGHTTLENLQVLSLRMLKYKPKIVIYMGFRNDYYSYGTTLDNSVDVNLYGRSLAPLPSTTVNETMMRSSLLALLSERLGWYLQYDNQLSGRTLHTYSDITPRAIDTIGNNIALMHALCVRHNITLVWVDQPINYSGANADMVNLERFRQIVQEECKRSDIPMLKAHEHIAMLKTGMLDEVHFSDKGNEILAGVIHAQLGGLLKSQ